MKLFQAFLPVIALLISNCRSKENISPERPGTPAILTAAADFKVTYAQVAYGPRVGIVSTRSQDITTYDYYMKIELQNHIDTIEIDSFYVGKGKRAADDLTIHFDLTPPSINNSFQDPYIADTSNTLIIKSWRLPLSLQDDSTTRELHFQANFISYKNNGWDTKEENYPMVMVPHSFSHGGLISYRKNGKRMYYVLEDFLLIFEPKVKPM
ncbi:MAG TPA: hypothetical protein VF691_00965 [Cytophagaceae bacterium]|jgi:hypothetical protein